MDPKQFDPRMISVVEDTPRGSMSYDIYSRLHKAVSYTHLTLPTIYSV